MNSRSANTTTLRTQTEIARFFTGLEMLDPGLVQVHRWQPGSVAPDDGEQIPGYTGWPASLADGQTGRHGRSAARTCRSRAHNAPRMTRVRVAAR